MSALVVCPDCGRERHVEYALVCPWCKSAADPVEPTLTQQMQVVRTRLDGTKMRSYETPWTAYVEGALLPLLERIVARLEEER